MNLIVKCYHFINCFYPSIVLLYMIMLSQYHGYHLTSAFVKQTN